MSDLYIESFFHQGTSSAVKQESRNPLSAVVTQTSIDQPHFYFRVLAEEVQKLFKDIPPFPLLLKKIEMTILSQDNAKTVELLDDLEELLDIKHLSNE